MTAPDRKSIATVAKINPSDPMIKFMVATLGSTSPGVSVAIRSAIFIMTCNTVAAPTIIAAVAIRYTQLETVVLTSYPLLCHPGRLAGTETLILNVVIVVSCGRGSRNSDTP